MAVRRISDLPELKSNYPAAALSSSLIEVSYSPRNAVYQSFYAKMNDVLSLLVDNMPRATHSQFGIVKIGPNISVIENDSDPNKGLINVLPATTSKLGLVKIGSNITVDANGVISTSQATISQTVKPQNATEIAKINSTSIYAPTVDVQPATAATGPTLATIRVGNVVKEIKGAETAANVRVEPIAHGTEIAKIYVNGIETALSDSVDANAFKGFLGFPDYSSAVSYKVYSYRDGARGLIIFRFAVPFDAYLILDRQKESEKPLMQNIIGSHLNPGFTIADGLNAEQFGYYAKADDIIYAKIFPSSNALKPLAGTITVYPLTNGNVSTSTDVINVTDKNYVTAQELYIKCKAQLNITDQDLKILDTFKMYGSVIKNVAPPVAGNDWPTAKWTEITNPDDTREFHNAGISIKLKANYIGQINYTYGDIKKSAAIEGGRLYNIIIAKTSYNHGPYDISRFGNIRFTCQSINRQLVAQWNYDNPSPKFIEFDYSQGKWNTNNLVTYPNQWPTEE